MKTDCAGFPWRSAAVDTRVRRQPTPSSGDRETDFMLRRAVVGGSGRGHLKLVAGQAITVCSDKPLITKLRRFLISKIRKELRNRRYAGHPQKIPCAGCGDVKQVTLRSHDFIKMTLVPRSEQALFVGNDVV